MGFSAIAFELGVDPQQISAFALRSVESGAVTPVVVDDLDEARQARAETGRPDQYDILNADHEAAREGTREGLWSQCAYACVRTRAVGARREK